MIFLNYKSKELIFEIMEKYSKFLDNVFTSKANVLLFLKSKIKKSKIEDLYIFTLNNWLTNKSKILNDISNLFKYNIRSWRGRGRR